MKDKPTPIWLRVDGELRRWVKREAKSRGMTLSEFVRHTLVKSKEKGEAQNGERISTG